MLIPVQDIEVSTIPIREKFFPNFESTNVYAFLNIVHAAN